MIRINKYLSMCGVSSRRGAEKLITEGQVTCNNQTIEQVGMVIDETKDEIRVDGTLVKPVEDYYYIVVNKPRMVMTTLHDPFKRKTVAHLIKEFKQRVFPVGRLDYDAEGVLLMTNHGDLAYRLTHPKYNVEKIYNVKVKGNFTQINGDRIVRGIKLDDGKIGKAKSFQIISTNKSFSKIKITMTEGRKREVKQLCASVGHPVVNLMRTEFCGITLNGISKGKWRYLSDKEIEKLHKIVGIQYQTESLQ